MEEVQHSVSLPLSAFVDRWGDDIEHVFPSLILSPALEGLQEENTKDGFLIYVEKGQLYIGCVKVPCDSLAGTRESRWTQVGR